MLKIRALWRTYREALCLTQEEAAELTGYSRNTISGWEGRNGPMVCADALWTLHELYQERIAERKATG